MSERSFEAPIGHDDTGVEPQFGGPEFLGEHEERTGGDDYGEHGERIHESYNQNESHEATGEAPLF